MRRVAAVAVVVVLIALRFVSLGGDPPLFKPLSNMTDEGVWVHNARNRALYGTPFVDDVAFGPTTAPLLDLLVGAVFAVAGPGLPAARTVSAVAGAATIVVLWDLLRRHYAPFAAWLGVCCFALNDALFAYSRLALPEMLQLACLTASLALELRAGGRPARSALAGAAWGAAILAKISAGYLAPAYLAWWLWLAWRERRGMLVIRRAAPFLGGAAALLLAFLLWRGVDPERVALMHVASNRRVLVQGAADVPRALLTLVTNRFWGTPSIALLLAAAGGLALAWMGGEPRALGERVRRARPSTVLAAIWLVVPAAVLGLTVRLQDDQRLLLFTVPLAVLATAVFDARGAAGSATTPAPSRLAGAVAGGALVLTAAGLLWATPLRAVAAGWPVTIVVGVPLVIGVAVAAGASRRPVSGDAVLTIAAASGLALLGTAIAAVTAPAIGAVGAGVVMLAVTATLVLWARALRSGWRAARGVALATFAVCYVAAAGTPVALALARPHASLPDGSRVLARLAPPGGVVTGPYAESLAVASPLFPLWLSPKDPDKGRINRDARLADVDVVLEDPSRPGPFVRHDELGVPFRERATIPLFFDPLRGVPRVTVKAYVRERP